MILAPAESVMPWDLFIYKATLLAVVDLQYTLSYCTNCCILSYCSPVCMIVCGRQEGLTFHVIINTSRYDHFVDISPTAVLH